MAITSSASGIGRIESILGEDAEDLLGHVCTTISRDRLHLPGPDFVDRVVADTRPADAGAALAAEHLRPRPPGRHGLRLDPARRPGHRALRRRLVREEPGLLRPREHRQARDRGRLQRGRLDARRAGRGARASTRTASRSCVKLNHNEFLSYPNKYDQIMFAQVEQALRAWAPSPSARRSTSARRSRSGRSSEVSQAFAAAHELGMATVLWCYLRNSAFNAEGRRARLPHRRRPDRPGQPPGRHDRGRHHQAEAARDGGSRLHRPRASARPTSASTATS